MTDETKAELVRRAGSFAKYHEEHARHGGAGREFHERAGSYLRADVPGVVGALDIAQARAAYWKAYSAALEAWHEHDEEQQNGSPALIVEAMASKAEARDDDVAALREKLRALGVEP